ncbi:NmrA-like family domain-containing protein [Lachnellula hyalina]|uniref:NmrA-like family domain-containing protein n=1 Tax=Lachnellula hyalina TaxID=1316788 RepID=A0A8H8U3M5_9HELO|nr:NmrA-like family domain-containing protein [Lachnellula hyalina]TVY29322.1 NmrA-like family domain-containing protein [Lachnellula hyalina]
MSAQLKSSLPQKLVVVVGATGGQGGSVINSLLADGSYRLRGITRSPQSRNSQALTAKGVEMITADLNDAESAIVAFKDANIVFAVTNYFETFATSGPEEAMKVEYAQGVNMAKAASVTTGLEHFIWSTLPNRKAISNGKCPVPHCDAKAQVDAFIKKDKALLAKTTFLWTGFFAETMHHPMLLPNLLQSAGKHVWLQPCPASTLVFTIGDHTINIGHFVHAIIKQPKLTLHGNYVFATTEVTTMGKLLEHWSEVTGKETEYLHITLEEYNRLWPMWGLEVGIDLKCWDEFGAESWASEKWIGREELGLGQELVGFRDALVTLLKSPHD